MCVVSFLERGVRPGGREGVGGVRGKRGSEGH